MKLIVGLGNPDKIYQSTRHNLGSNILKKLIGQNKFKNKSKLNALIFEDQKNIFAIPTEYMNNSGITVQKIANFYKINPSDIYIIHDDLDLEVGDYKIQFDRGPAGHNGIKSIIEHLDTQQFNRIRIGISKPTNNIPVEDYVLKPFSKEEKNKIENITTEIQNFIKEI